MKKRIQKLIDDIRNITQKLPPKKHSGNSLFFLLERDDISDLEAIVDSSDTRTEDDKVTLFKITGINKNKLPSEETISPHEQAQLAEELQNMLEHFNFILDFPEEFPLMFRYSLIRKLWDDKIFPEEEYYIEFCQGPEKICPYPGFCFYCSNAVNDFDDANPVNQINDTNRFHPETLELMLGRALKETKYFHGNN